MSVPEDAHTAVSVGIAERFLIQPAHMPWESRCDELASDAIEAMQLFIQTQRQSLPAHPPLNRSNPNEPG
jgi:hypothetical protein